MLGCLPCVGTQNEFGIRDTKCANDDGTASGNFVTLCKADSSGWDYANNTMCVDPNSSCSSPSTNISAPPQSGNYCHGVLFDFAATESNLKQNAGRGCVDFFNDATEAPLSCPLLGGGTAPDCCGHFCYADEMPTPAACFNNN